MESVCTRSSTYTGALFTRRRHQSGDGYRRRQSAAGMGCHHRYSSVVLAVIDTGIVNHQDLNGAGIVAV